jgi:phage terminase large subunit-like protein
MDRTTQYAADVINGKELAGRYVKLACQRHLNDLEKSKSAPYKSQVCVLLQHWCQALLFLICSEQ